jgi:hypothetical protein
MITAFIIKTRYINRNVPFWRGVMWAAKAAKMGYRWKIGNGDFGKIAGLEPAVWLFSIGNCTQ